jgi:hypothetical protein
MIPDYNISSLSRSDEEKIVKIVSGYRIQNYLTEQDIDKLREESFPKTGLSKILSTLLNK